MLNIEKFRDFIPENTFSREMMEYLHERHIFVGYSHCQETISLAILFLLVVKFLKRFFLISRENTN